MQGFFPQLLFLMPGIPGQENKKLQQLFVYKVYSADTALLKSLTLNWLKNSTQMWQEMKWGEEGVHKLYWL